VSPVTTMPFGKHQGVPLADLPDGYLTWLGTKLNEWRDPFRSALAAEIARRKGQTLPNVVNGPTSAPTRAGSARRSASELPAAAVCDICGLPGTTQRPLVHANCPHDEIPF